METKWEFIESSGKIRKESVTVDEIQRAESMVFIQAPNEKVISHGIILEDFSKVWIFTKDVFYYANSFGVKISFPYRAISKTSLHPSEAYKKPESFDILIKINEQDVIDNLGNMKKVTDTTCYSIKNTGNMEELLRLLDKCFSHNRQ